MHRLYTFLIAIFLLMVSDHYVTAQARVTGHVFAEVVESAEVRSEMNSQFSMKSNENTTTLQLGNFNIRGGSNVAGAVVVTCTDLNGLNGTSVGFSASSASASATPVLNEDGNEVVNLSGEVDQALYAMNERAYSGQYHVVFAYN
jgi:hypothetical protein